MDPRIKKEGMRIGFLNLNSLKFDTREQETALGMSTMLDLNFDVFCCQEVNKDLRDFDLSTRWHRFVRKHLGQRTYHKTSSPSPGSATSPGGLLSIMGKAIA